MWRSSRSGDDSRERAERETRQPGSTKRPVAPAPEEPEVQELHELRRSHMQRHRGRRQDDPGRPRRTREERVQDLLKLLGTYRVVSRRSVVEYCFDGHPFAANRTLPRLGREGLIAVRTLRAGKKGYQVFSLTAAGRDRLVFGVRKRRRRSDEEEDADLQRYWTGLADVRQLEHDHHVFEAIMQDTEDVRACGGRIRRVRLESELRGLLAAAGETARRSEGAGGAERARRREAVRIGLSVFAKGVPLPDALVEVEGADGRRSVRAVEVVTGSYTTTQVREKQQARFRLYAIPGFLTARKRRGFGTVDWEESFPLSWGRG